MIRPIQANPPAIEQLIISVYNNLHKFLINSVLLCVQTLLLGVRDPWRTVNSPSQIIVDPQ